VIASGISTATQITAGVSFTCALDAEGTVKCWGFNGTNELGDGTSTDRSTPVKVIGIAGSTSTTSTSTTTPRNTTTTLAPLGSQTRTWTGGAPSRYWSEPRNWADGVPRSGDALVFPGAANQRHAGINDLSGLVVRSITFSGSLPDAETYVISGNKVVLEGGVVVDLPNPHFGHHQIDFPVELRPSAGSQSIWDIRQDNFASTGANNTILSGTAGLTKIGEGSLGVFSSTYSGPTILDAGRLDVFGKQLSERFLVDAGTLRLSGGADVGPISVKGGTLFVEPRETKSKALELTNAATMMYQIGTSNEAGHPCGRLAVAGTVRLGNSRLQIDPISQITPVGTSCVIVANDGTHPIEGIFAGLAEGSVMTATIYATDGVTPVTASFQISYTGGDGNDVTLTRV